MVVVALCCLLAGAAGYAVEATSEHKISQKGRSFRPGEVTIAPGETLRLVNDDSDLLHHAYVETPEFKFDTGDQEPGSITDVRFPIAGTFTVLCGIHPKMKLVVRVH